MILNNSSKITKMKQLILQPFDNRNLFLKKLNDYKYIDNISDLHVGSFLRWINEDENLTRGGILIDIKITEKGLVLLIKTFTKRIFYIQFSPESLVFQKLSLEEKLLLDVMNYINE